MQFSNEDIAAHFEQLADLLEFQGANPFKLKAYRNGARVLRELEESVAAIALDPNRDLRDFDGIGDAVAEKTKALVTTGVIPQLEELKKEVPESVLALLRVPGLGPKKAATLFHELGIKTLDDLKAACEGGKVREIKGFGAKTEATILAGISIAAEASKRILWCDAHSIAEDLRSHLASCPAVKRFEFAGSYRRGKETVGDLDILVVSDHPTEVMSHFGSYPSIKSVLGQGDTKMSVRIDHAFQVDLRVVPNESFGAALQYFTGSKDHNVLVRGEAKKLGLKVNEWGVFKVDGEKEEYVAGVDEVDVYRAIGFHLVPPELREARRELEWAKSGQFPNLLEVSEVRGDLHMHTTETDGSATLEEMAEAARARGLEYIAITDHSQRVSMARGLNSERLLAQWKAIDAWNAKSDGSFRILKGIECDILEAGGMDLPDEVLAQADWVLASVHYGQNQPREQITDRILGALKNEHVDAIAHPTGRLLTRREPYQVDMEAVMQASVEFGKALELNANPYRLDLNDVHLSAAIARKIPIVINSDAHSTNGLDVMRYGVVQARRGALTSEHVLNTLPLAQLEKWIESKKR